MRDPELTLLKRVARGNLNFERFVELLRTKGYVIDSMASEGCGFGRVAMDSVRQDDLEALFAFFFPNELLDIKLEQVATDDGGQRGAFSSALFNSNLLSREEVKGVLREHNRQFNS